MDARATTGYWPVMASIPSHWLWTIAAALLVYPVCISLLIIPAFQNQVIYLNAFKMTWRQDLSMPEQWGFLHNQVTPFWLSTEDGERLLAWHILPLGLYLMHEQELSQTPSGVAEDITQTLGFRLLKEEMDSKLVLYFHGAAGTLGSGYRPPSYHAIAASDINNTHIIAIDYRGFGISSGKPSEAGLLKDAMTLVKFALNTASISPKKIVLFGQSLGTAVAVTVSHRLATQPTPVLFSGMVLVAPFASVEALTATYRIAGTIPLLDPLSKFPKLMAYLNSRILAKWNTKDKIAAFIQTLDTRKAIGERHHISFIHGKDDYDIPYKHSEVLFNSSINAMATTGDSLEAVQSKVDQSRISLGSGGYSLSHTGNSGSVSLNILEYGLHDKIMGYPVVSRAIARAFSSND